MVTMHDYEYRDLLARIEFLEGEKKNLETGVNGLHSKLRLAEHNLHTAYREIEGLKADIAAGADAVKYATEHKQLNEFYRENINTLVYRGWELAKAAKAIETDKSDWAKRELKRLADLVGELFMTYKKRGFGANAPAGDATPKTLFD